MELEKLLQPDSGNSPLTGTVQVVTSEAALTRIRLVANGGACRVILYDFSTAVGAPAAVEITRMEAVVGAPDETVLAADRKLKFKNVISVNFTGAGWLYLYYT